MYTFELVVENGVTYLVLGELRIKLSAREATMLQDQELPGEVPKKEQEEEAARPSSLFDQLKQRGAKNDER
jgi:hypothetical protein